MKAWNILLSIDPEWAEAILDGEKEWEYRKQLPARDDPPYRLVLYATAPVQAPVGCAWADKVMRDQPVENLISWTIERTPHDPAEIEDYFDGRDEGSAYHIAHTRRFQSPDDLVHTMPDPDNPPQNFQYMSKAPVPEKIKFLIDQ